VRFDLAYKYLPSHRLPFSELIDQIVFCHLPFSELIDLGVFCPFVLEFLEQCSSFWRALSTKKALSDKDLSRFVLMFYDFQHDGRKFEKKCQSKGSSASEEKIAQGGIYPLNFLEH
jgi:hypothetical protein